MPLLRAFSEPSRRLEASIALVLNLYPTHHQLPDQVGMFGKLRTSFTRYFPMKPHRYKRAVDYPVKGFVILSSFQMACLLPQQMACKSM
jgi:hypothetical protein